MCIVFYDLHVNVNGRDVFLYLLRRQTLGDKCHGFLRAFLTSRLGNFAAGVMKTVYIFFYFFSNYIIWCRIQLCVLCLWCALKSLQSDCGPFSLALELSVWQCNFFMLSMAVCSKTCRLYGSFDTGFVSFDCCRFDDLFWARSNNVFAWWLVFCAV